MAREVYAHVPDADWPGWEGTAAQLLEKLGRPLTTDEVLQWCLGERFDVSGFGQGRMGVARRTSLARNTLAWLSVRGKVDFSRGRWRRVGREGSFYY